MKKITITLLSFLLATQAFAHEGHSHQNPNITPFHDATEVNDGYKYSKLAKQVAWQEFKAKYDSWGAFFDRRTHLPHRALGKPIMVLPGINNVEMKAKAFLQNEFKGFNLPIDELVMTRNVNDGKYINVDFKQIHEGKEVLWSRVTIRFTQKMEIILFGIDMHRNIPNVTPVLQSHQAIVSAENAIATQVISSEVSNDLVWFPFPNGNQYEYKLAYKVTVNTQDDETTPGKYVTYIDASNGEVLYRQNKVVNVGFTVQADAYPTNLFAPSAMLPLKNLLVKVTGNSTSYYTDLNGFVNLPGASTVNADLTLSGKYVRIATGASGTVSPVTQATNISNNATVSFPLSNPNAGIQHMTCYYHANEVHDFMKTKIPQFVAMDDPMLTRVDRTDGNCNAFYNGSSINFYTTSNGCNALSMVNSVVYHEYGHGITNEFWADQGTIFENGGMGEGYSDVWAMSITKNPIVGQGFNVNAPNSFIRRYDQAPKVYPANLVGQVHADGEIIAGAWWSVAGFMGGNLSTAIDTMSQIFAESHYGLANGPDGTEGQVYHDILLDALEYDDDNNNIFDGTPHFQAIVKGFARHGIYLLNQSEIEHEGNITTQLTNSIPISAVAITEFKPFLGDVKMFVRKRGTTALDSVLMVKTNDTIFNGNFTPTNASAGDIYEYYFMLYDDANIPNIDAPLQGKFSVGFSQRNLPFYILYGYKPVFTENFDAIAPSTANWQFGLSTDPVTLTSKGKWDVGTPISSKTIEGEVVQTGMDHTSGTGKCAFTGNASSATAQPTAADVDGGRTTLITQEFDLTPYNKPVVSYWRWFTNSQGNSPRKDNWQTWVSYNNGVNWTSLERSYQPDVSWRRQIIVPSQGSATIKLRFVALDSIDAVNTTGSLVEAAVDDIQIFDIDTSPLGLLNQQGLEAAVFPNPANRNVTVLTQDQGELTYELVNTVGAKIQQGSQLTNGNMQIQLQNITSGLYFLRVELNGKKYIQKLNIVQ